MKLNHYASSHRISILPVLIASLLILMVPSCLTFSKNLSSADISVQNTPPLNLQCDDLSALQPKVVYILVDESYSANAHDTSGNLRYSVATLISDFASAYGWLASAPPIIYIYRYSTEYKESTGYTDKIWPPEGAFPNPQILLNDPHTTSAIGLSDIDRELRSYVVPRSLDSSRVENLYQTLEYVKGQITSHPLIDNTMLFIITEGYPEEEHSSESIDVTLERVSHIWDESGINRVPIAVALYSSDSRRLPYLVDNWNEHFLQQVKNPTLQKPLPLLMLESNMGNYGTVWDWMISLYQQIGMFNSTGVHIGKMPGSQRSKLTFLESASNLSIATYWDGESDGLIVTDEDIFQNIEPNKEGLLNWWNMLLNDDSLTMQNGIHVESGNKFIYHCMFTRNSASDISTATPFVENVPSSQPTPGPSSLPVNKPIIINLASGFVSLLLVVFTTVFMFQVRNKINYHFFAAAAFIWLSLDVVFTILDFLLASRLNLDALLTNLVADVIIIIIFGGGGSGVFIQLFKSIFIDNKPQDKFGSFLYFASPALGGLLVVLLTIFGSLL